MTPRASADAERWRLHDEREFLLRSLADADAEHEAGDLSDDDHAALQRRDSERLAQVEEALAGGGPATAMGPGPSRVSRPERDPTTSRPEGRARGTGTRRRARHALVAGGGIAAIVAGIIVLVVSLTTARLPGESSSGSVELARPQEIARELAQAADLENRGNLSQALEVYQQVLGQDPSQPQALAERGWIEYEAGVTAGDSALVGRGRASVLQAIAAQPHGYAPHLYLGMIDFQHDHDPAAAVVQFRLFLAGKPPSQLIANAAPYLRESFAQVGQPLPAGVPPAS